MDSCSSTPSMSKAKAKSGTGRLSPAALLSSLKNLAVDCKRKLLLQVEKYEEYQIRVAALNCLIKCDFILLHAKEKRDLSAGTGLVDGTTTVVERTTGAPPSTIASPPRGSAAFDPAALYAARAPGVVTIYANLGIDGEAQGSGFVVDDAG